MGRSKLWTAFVMVALTGCQDFLAGHYAVTQDVSCGNLQIRDREKCVHVGVRECGGGFASDAQGGCLPVLYQSTCQAGALRVLGSTCSSLGFANCPDSKYTNWPVSDRSARYVSADAPTHGNGSADQPFASIADALASTDEDLTILLARGTYPASIVVEGRHVRISGTCATQVELRGAPGHAVLEFGPGSDGSRIEGVGIRGGGDGVRVSGAQDIRMTGIWVYRTGDHGISVDDSRGLASATLERSLVEEATDIAVSTYGGALTVRESEIRNVRPRNPGGRALGLVARPSLLLSKDLDLANRRPAALCIVRSIIDNCRGSGIFAEESNLDVRESLIRSVDGSSREPGHGITIRAQAARSIQLGQVEQSATECSADDETPLGLDIRQSVIEGTRDVGISVWNADARVSDTVIRRIGHEAWEGSTARCLGNGIRGRRDLLRPFLSEPRIEIARSVIESTAGAGVHVDGESLLVEDSVIRDSGRETCGESTGDGVTVLASPTLPGLGTIRRTWIAGSSRAAVSTFEGKIALQSTVLACNAGSTLGAGITDENVSCECRGSQFPCGDPGAALENDSFGGAGCDDRDTTGCFRASIGAMGDFQSALPGVTVWSYDHEDVASRMSSSDGSIELEGLPFDAPTVVAATQGGSFTGIAMVAPLVRDSEIWPRILMPRLASAESGETLLGTLFNARNGLLVVLRVGSPGTELEFAL